MEQASAENSSSTSLLVEMLDDLQDDSMKREPEAATLEGGGSSLRIGILTKIKLWTL